MKRISEQFTISKQRVFQVVYEDTLPKFFGQKGNFRHRDYRDLAVVLPHLDDVLWVIKERKKEIAEEDIAYDKELDDLYGYADRLACIILRSRRGYRR